MRKATTAAENQASANLRGVAQVAIQGGTSAFFGVTNAEASSVRGLLTVPGLTEAFTSEFIG